MSDLSDLTDRDVPVPVTTDGESVLQRVARRTQAQRKATTRAALRAAGLRLFAEKGFDRTTTDDIAKAAGVSPRTFFNHFTSKDSVAQVPRALLVDNLRAGILGRPDGEDPATSLAVATALTFDAVADHGGAVGVGLLRTGLRLMKRFPLMQRRAWERRSDLEEVAWQALLDRGTAPTDIGARMSVTIVLSIGWQAMLTWSEQDGDETMSDVLRRCLLASPHPERFAPGPDR